MDETRTPVPQQEERLERAILRLENATWDIATTGYSEGSNGYRAYEEEREAAREEVRAALRGTEQPAGVEAREDEVQPERTLTLADEIVERLELGRDRALDVLLERLDRLERLRATPAQQAEPVAYLVECEVEPGVWEFHYLRGRHQNPQNLPWNREGWRIRPLVYADAAPPAQAHIDEAQPLPVNWGTPDGKPPSISGGSAPAPQPVEPEERFPSRTMVVCDVCGSKRCSTVGGVNICPGYDPFKQREPAEPDSGDKKGAENVTPPGIAEVEAVYGKMERADTVSSHTTPPAPPGEELERDDWPNGRNDREEPLPDTPERLARELEIICNQMGASAYFVMERAILRRTIAFLRRPTEGTRIEGWATNSASDHDAALRRGLREDAE